MSKLMDDARARRDAAATPEAPPAAPPPRRKAPMLNTGPRQPLVPTFSDQREAPAPTGPVAPAAQAWLLPAAVVGLALIALILLPRVGGGPVPMGAPDAPPAPAEAPRAPWPPPGVTPEPTAPPTPAPTTTLPPNPTALPGSFIEPVNPAPPQAPAAPAPAYVPPPPAAPPPPVVEGPISDLVPIYESEKGSRPASGALSGRGQP